MPITSAWTAPSTLDRNVGDVLSEAIWDNLVSNELYLWDSLHNYARAAAILSMTIGAADANLYRPSAGNLKTDAALRAATSITANHTGAGQVNLADLGGGKAGIEFGNAGDTNIYRGAANTLQSDDYFIAAGLRAQVPSTGTEAWATYIAGESFLRLLIVGNGTLNWGPGNLTQDVNLYRSAADTLKTDDNFVAASVSAPNVETRLAEAVLGAPAASIAFTSIPATYRHLRLTLQTRSTAAVKGCEVRVRFNSDSGTNYTSQYAYAYNATQVANAPASTTSGDIGRTPGTTGLAGFRSVLDAVIADYAGASYKSVVSAFHGQDGNTALFQSVGTVGTFWSSTVAINRIDVFLSSGNLDTGTVATLYGS